MQYYQSYTIEQELPSIQQQMNVTSDNERDENEISQQIMNIENNFNNFNQQFETNLEIYNTTFDNNYINTYQNNFDNNLENLENTYQNNFEQQTRMIITSPVAKEKPQEELDIVPKDRPWNAPKYIKQKKDNQDYEMYQQVVLIGLINKYAEITLERPNKQTKVSISIPKILIISFNEIDSINISSFTEKQCKELCEKEVHDGLSQTTAMRRLEKNKKVYLLNLLIDIAAELGMKIDSTMSRRSNKSLQVERIQSISMENEFHFTKNQIIEFGKQLNEYYLELLTNEKTITLPVKDSRIQQILFGSCM